jgi:DNA polymerase III epsilon subunit-like protein
MGGRATARGLEVGRWGKGLIVAIDFETTGLSPDQGARTIEVAAAVVENGQVVARYQPSSKRPLMKLASPNITSTAAGARRTMSFVIPIR